jgi:hypothetical protein
LKARDKTFGLDSSVSRTSLSGQTQAPLPGNFAR